MKISVGKIALILWLVTILSIVFYVVRGGVVEKQVGARTIIQLDQNERDLVLDEMRTMLQATQMIVEGVANSDLKQISAAGKAGGMGAAVDLDPKFLSKLPLEFKTLGFSMHSDMDSIAKSAESGATPKEISRMLSATLLKCVGCHSSWQIKAND